MQNAQFTIHNSLPMRTKALRLPAGRQGISEAAYASLLKCMMKNHNAGISSLIYKHLVT